MLTEQPELSPYDIVKGYWATQHKGADFEAWWRRAVHDGVVPDTAAAGANARGSRRGAGARRRSRSSSEASWK